MTIQPNRTFGPVGDLALAVGLLTRLPVRTPPGLQPMGRTVYWFPLVGVLVGGLGSAAYVGARYMFTTSWLAAVIAVGVMALATGALHEDGLADVADGFGGAFDRARKLEIMHDSRLGTYGALALMLSQLLRIGAIAAMGEIGYTVALMIAGAVLSRAAIAVVMAVGRRQGDGLGAAGGRAPGWAALLAIVGAVAISGLALLWFAAGGGIAPGGDLLALLVAATAVGTLAMVALAHVQIGGYTGDVLGAVQQAAEIGVLIVGLGAMRWLA